MKEPSKERDSTKRGLNADSERSAKAPRVEKPSTPIITPKIAAGDVRIIIPGEANRATDEIQKFLISKSIRPSFSVKSLPTRDTLLRISVEEGNATAILHNFLKRRSDLGKVVYEKLTFEYTLIVPEPPLDEKQIERVIKEMRTHVAIAKVRAVHQATRQSKSGNLVLVYQVNTEVDATKLASYYVPTILGMEGHWRHPETNFRSKRILVLDTHPRIPPHLTDLQVEKDLKRKLPSSISKTITAVVSGTTRSGRDYARSNPRYVYFRTANATLLANELEKFCVHFGTQSTECRFTIPQKPTNEFTSELPSDTGILPQIPKPSESASDIVVLSQTPTSTPSKSTAPAAPADSTSAITPQSVST